MSQRQCTLQLTGGCLGAKVESIFNVMEMMLLCSIINVYPYRCVANVIKYLFTEVLNELSETEWESSSEPLRKSVQNLQHLCLTPAV